MIFYGIDIRKAATVTYFARRESPVEPSPWVRIMVGAWPEKVAGKEAEKLSVEGWEARSVELTEEEMSKMTPTECDDAAERSGQNCSCNSEIDHWCDWCRYVEEYWGGSF